MSNYIGNNPPFGYGDKVRIRDGYTFMIEQSLKDGAISYKEEYTFIGYNGYGCGSNYCVLKEVHDLPEHALERV